MFFYIPFDTIASIFDLTIILKNEIIQCNFLFATLLSKRILSELVSDNPNEFIDFSDFEESNLLKSIFDLLRGFPLHLKDINSLNLSAAIKYLEFDLLSLFLENQSPETDSSPSDSIASKFSTIDFNELLNLPKDFIHRVISSRFIHLQNEKQLFDFIYLLIMKDRSSIKFLRYVSGWGLNEVSSMIDSIKIEDICFDLFIFFKNCFKFGFLMREKPNLNSFAEQGMMNYTSIASKIFILQQDIKMLSRYIIPDIHENIILGMNSLKAHRSLRSNRIFAFKLFNELADEGDPEASWRTAACYYNGWGCDMDKKKCQEYAKIAIEYDIGEGYFWYGRASESLSEQFSYFKEAADLSNLSGIFWEGVYQYFGLSVPKNVEVGKEMILSITN
jgi:hypothetical protein